MSAPVVVTVGATSANLGSGFDSLGLCLDWYDEVRCTPSATTSVVVHGQGADHVSRGEDHLVLRTVRTGLRALGAPAGGGFALECYNTIPQARGLGSSAAAIVAGLSLAWGLARPHDPLDRVWVARVAADIEGHPDNVFPAALGGAVLAWPAVGSGRVEHWSLPVAAALRIRVWVPQHRVPTTEAREVLPETIDRAVATQQSVSLAVLIEALRARPGWLLTGTQGEWHQQARAPLMPASAQLTAALRGQGVAAAISGAGPSVIALGTAEQLAIAHDVADPDFEVRDLRVGHGVRLCGDEEPDRP